VSIVDSCNVSIVASTVDSGNMSIGDSCIVLIVDSGKCVNYSQM
jgi:hypothetical protein